MNISNYTQMDYNNMNLNNYLVGLEYESLFFSLAPLLLMLAGFVYGVKKDLGNGLIIGALLGLLTSILFTPIYLSTNHTLFGLGFTSIFALIILVIGVLYTFIAGKQYQQKRLFNISILILLLSSLIHPMNITINTEYVTPTDNPYIKFTLTNVNGTANCTIINNNIIRDGFTNIKDGIYFSYFNMSYGKNKIKIDCTDETKNSGTNIVFTSSKEIIVYNKETSMELIYLLSALACILSLPMLTFFNIVKYKSVIELGIYSIILNLIIISGISPMNYYFTHFTPLYWIGFTLATINIIVSFPLLITTLIDEYKNRKI